MIYWILTLLSFVFLGLIFWRRYKYNKLLSSGRGMIIEEPSSTEQTEEDQINTFSKVLNPSERLEVNNLFRSAESFFASNEMDEAERLYIQVIARDENHKESNARLGLIYLKKELPLKAEAVYRKLVSFHENEASFFSNLALALYLQRRLEDARDVYLRAISLDTKRAQRHMNLAQVYRDLEDYENAMKSVGTALDLEPQNNEYRLFLAQLFFDLNRFEDAKIITQNILKHEPVESELRPIARVLLKRIEAKL